MRPVRLGLSRPLLGLLLAGLLLPLVPLLVWAVSAQWRYPALVPQQLSGRGVRILTDPRSQVVHGLRTSALIGGVAGLRDRAAGRAAPWCS